MQILLFWMFSSLAPTPYLNAAAWKHLFPHQNALYTYDAFQRAAARFPKFLNEGDDQTRRRELAAFLANVSQETSGGWDAVPGGYTTWGLYFTEEKTNATYNDTSKHDYPAVAGKTYHGRGPAQLSWNYNYGQFSQAWFGDKSILLNDPDRVCKDPELAWASAIWFWMTAQHPKPSCHEAIVGQKGFGATINIINGGIECGKGTELPQTRHRIDFYRTFCEYLKTTPGEDTGCAEQSPYGQPRANQPRSA